MTKVTNIQSMTLSEIGIFTYKARSSLRPGYVRHFACENVSETGQWNVGFGSPFAPISF